MNPTTSGVSELLPQSVEEHSKQCVGLATRLRKKLGTLDGYWEVFDPTEEKEAIYGALSADLADIYMDLKEPAEPGTNRLADADVCSQWRFDFVSHWSHHAASALKVLFRLSNRV
jgi:hypothetical protein